MNFIFTRRFLILAACAAPLYAGGWLSRTFIMTALTFDGVLVIAAIADYLISESPSAFKLSRFVERRFQMGTANRVELEIASECGREVSLWIRDEYPPEMEPNEKEQQLSLGSRRTVRVEYHLFADRRGDFDFGRTGIRYASRFGLIWRQSRCGSAQRVKVYPNFDEAKRNELYAHRNRALRLGQRRMVLRGHGREFESLREFVQGDEMRHICWPATARRGKLVTRQYQVERSQNVVVMLDAGRLMTARIERLSKLDHAINAALSIAYVALSGGDNIGLLTFSRKVLSYLPPKRGMDQLGRVMEALYNVTAEMIEPSYARAFNHLSQNCRRRSLVIILTDVIDEEGSADLLAHTSSLLPRHLPLIVTIGDNDLRALVARLPATVADVYQQSVAEDLIRQREAALGRITHLGGLALDVPAGRLSFEVVNQYLDVKERGLL